MVDRITLLLKAKNITASQFADDIGVQRSSISHVLSARNKPSLDFIQKILKRYPEVNPDWLLFGKGAMNLGFNLFSETDESIPLREEVISKALQRQEKLIRPIAEKEDINEIPEIPEAIRASAVKQADVPVPQPAREAVQAMDFPADKAPVKQESTPESSLLSQAQPQEKIALPVSIPNVKEVERIVVFYKDRSFREYLPE